MTNQVLLDAAAIVRKGWTQGELAVDANGEFVWATHPKACKWCALGAMTLAVANQNKFVSRKLLKDAVAALSSAVGTRQLSYWNDAPERTAEQVALAMEAAANAE